MKYNTGKKEQILSFLLNNASSAFTLEEISSAIVPDGRGKSTVYRIVSELVESKDVKRISDGKTRHCTYQYIGADECFSHIHLKCRDCGKLIHLDENISQNFKNTLISYEGFSMEDGGIIFGKCVDCKEDIFRKSSNCPHKSDCNCRAKNKLPPNEVKI